ncbi:C4-dicarboxylate transporter DctQ subunit [Natronocella acetinitrilica]|uniref:TRAP transporter small permease protein n=1 Tax=Natronocella acetinitrilica TaxID=414046 RepID=A0AAE3G1Z6_9GAMM|nr:TRAP transporter small permease [Natronocella acetinitrilica]MCP1673559.1 C4-dicarboxylate transporter DctQ subunit [Natronocella acetinitrilica]
MPRPLRRALWVIDHVEEAILILCMTGITVLTFAAVLARYVFRMPIAGADEIATFLFLWAALFGAAAAFKYNQHGSMPLLADRLSPQARRVADLLVLAVTAAFFAFLTYYTWRFLAQSIRIGQRSSATGMPVWIINAGIFGALLLCSLRCAIAIIRDLAGLPRHKPMPGADDPTAENSIRQP